MMGMQADASEWLDPTFVTLTLFLDGFDPVP